MPYAMARNKFAVDEMAQRKNQCTLPALQAHSSDSVLYSNLLLFRNQRRGDPYTRTKRVYKEIIGELILTQFGIKSGFSRVLLELQMHLV